MEAHRRSVFCEGDKEFRYRANLHLRTGIRVLQELDHFRVRNQQELYEKLKKIDWSPWLKVDGSLWIDTVTQSDDFRNGVFLSQLFKDAVVDQFRERSGERPNVDKDAPDLNLHLHIDRQNYVSVSLNSSGPGLHRRGYRRKTGGAPLNEILAAGMLAIAEFDGEVPFVDPMCGSGTIVAEAATIAAHQAPGLRRDFGFQRWPDFDAALWSSIRQEALDAIRVPPHPVVGADIDELTVRLAKVTIDRTGLLPHVTLLHSPFNQLPAYSPNLERSDRAEPTKDGAVTTESEGVEANPGGLLVMNPPYEMRLKTGDIEGIYTDIGDTLKKKWAGYSAWIISGNTDALKAVGLKTSRRVPLMNGPLEVRYCRYDLYEGSR